MGNNNYNFTALTVAADTTINAGENGGIDTKGGAYGINVINGANLVINGGTYYGGGTAVQVQKGTVTINGGHFAVEPFSDASYGYNFLLNCIDSAYKDGTAKIIVKGGTFVNFNPANCKAEGAGTNFVADGYRLLPATQTMAMGTPSFAEYISPRFPLVKAANITLLRLCDTRTENAQAPCKAPRCFLGVCTCRADPVSPPQAMHFSAAHAGPALRDGMLNRACGTASRRPVSAAAPRCHCAARSDAAIRFSFF